MRVKPLLLILLIALSVALAACGTDDDSASSAGASSTTKQAAAGPDADAFPVTISHKYGSTTIDAEPRRVVVAGLREQDALLALGTVPVATTEWFGKHPGAIFPWAKATLGSAKLPTVLSSTACRSRRSRRSVPTSSSRSTPA
jgi:iron complex transport system substrate-binding protein